MNTWYLVLILEKELRYMIKTKKKFKMFEFLYIFYNLISGRYYKISWMDGNNYSGLEEEEAFHAPCINAGSRGIFIFLI